jgi:hypothetical protein
MNRLTKVFSGLAALSLASIGSAAILPTYVSTTTDGSDYRWSYSVSIGSGVRVQSGDYFTIYDFGGLDGGADMPANWAYSTADTGPVPYLLSPTDDPTIPNVTFEYTGSTSIIGPDTIGTFSVDSTGNLPTSTTWASYSTRNGGLQDGTFASDLGSTIAPEQITNPNIPEPASVGLGLGMIASAAIRRRK